MQDSTDRAGRGRPDVLDGLRNRAKRGGQQGGAVTEHTRISAKREAIEQYFIALEWEVPLESIDEIASTVCDQLLTYPGFDPTEWIGWELKLLIGPARPPNVRWPPRVTPSSDQPEPAFSLYRMRVSPPGQLAFVECHYRPLPIGAVISIGNVSLNSTTQDDLRDVWRGRHIITKIDGRGGRTKGDGAAYDGPIQYLEALATLTDRAKTERWNLENSTYHNVEWLAGKLKIKPSQFYVENTRAGIRVQDIRNGRITWSFVESRRASNSE